MKIKQNAFSLLLIFSLSIQAQRYKTEVFSSVDVSSGINYGSAPAWSTFPISLAMDIYEPNGDTETSRPLMILAHGGSFTAGSRTDAYIVAICESFAKRGYVTVSISYRLGINFANVSALDQELQKATIRAIQDFNASIRYFYKSARTDGNPYAIDTNRIIVGGYSAGSISAIHSQLFKIPASSPAFIQQSLSSLGGLEGGNNGSPSYPSRSVGLWNMAGAILDTSMVNLPDVPTIGFHGDADDVVPFGIGFASFNGTPIVEMHGSSIVDAKLQRIGATSAFHSYPGAGHDLLSNLVQADSILTKAARFFYQNVIQNASIGVDENFVSSKVFPNPLKAGSKLTVESTLPSEYELTDMNGRILKSGKLTIGYSQIDTEQLKSGTYILRILGGSKQIQNQKIVIQ